MCKESKSVLQRTCSGGTAASSRSHARSACSDSASDTAGLLAAATPPASTVAATPTPAATCSGVYLQHHRAYTHEHDSHQQPSYLQHHYGMRTLSAAKAALAQYSISSIHPPTLTSCHCNVSAVQMLPKQAHTELHLLVTL